MLIQNQQWKYLLLTTYLTKTINHFEKLGEGQVRRLSSVKNFDTKSTWHFDISEACVTEETSTRTENGSDSSCRDKLRLLRPDHAAARHGDVGIPPGRSGDYQGRHTWGHQGRVPPLRHRLRVWLWEAARGGDRRGPASRPGEVQGRALHHHQAVEQLRGKGHDRARHEDESKVCITWHQ